MADVTTDRGATVAAPPRRGPLRARAVLDTVLGPLWRTTFRDPVRTGRLRLDGLSRSERQLAKVGLVSLVLLLVSLLFVDRWREGTLLRLPGPDRARFLPEALLPITVCVFFVALALIVWGALAAGPSVRLVVAVVYAGTVGVLDAPAIGSETWIGLHGTTVVRIGFVIPIAALVASALLARWSRSMRWLTPVLRWLCLLAFAAMAATLLLMHRDSATTGLDQPLPVTLHGGFEIIDGLLTVLVIVAAIAVVDFASDVSTSVSEPATQARGRWLWAVRAVLLGVIALKLWLDVVDDRDYWSAYLDRQAESAVRTAVVLGLLLAACLFVNRVAAPGTDADVDEAKERLTLAGAAVVSAAYIMVILLLGFGQVSLTLTGSTRVAELGQEFPTDGVSTWLPLTVSVLALAGGCWLLHRHRTRPLRGHVRELATGMVVLGVWNLQAGIATAADLSFGFSYRTIDVLVTVGVLVWTVVRWRWLDAHRASLLLAVLLFSWLVMSRGDYISYRGGLFGLPALVVVVFGIVYTMASGSGFASESSPRLPRAARTLLYTGYLLLSVTILHWLQAAHHTTIDMGQLGFYYVAIPLAAWLVARRMLPRSERAVDPESDDQPDGTGDRSGPADGQAAAVLR